MTRTEHLEAIARTARELIVDYDEDIGECPVCNDNPSACDCGAAPLREALRAFDATGEVL